MTDVVAIAALGHRGDGIAKAGGEPLYVPQTLPGEVVRVIVSGNRAAVTEIIKPAADRILPVCGHFGTCGGCALQHVAADTVATWKRDQVVAALKNRGLAMDVDPTITTTLRSRRRAVFTACKTASGILIGFHGQRTNRIIPIDQCPVLRPSIVDALPALRMVADRLLAAPGQKARLTVTDTDNGLDVSINEAPKSALEATLVAASEGIDATIIRLSVAGETVYERAPATIRFGPASVNVPPGGFVQATADGENALANLVVQALGLTRKAADLFCGAGTFTFPIAECAAVHAVEYDAAALDALQSAARRATGLKPITTEHRDLFKRPLMATELGAFDAVIFDPPRAGAAEQATEIAKSTVRTVIAISCNPATFARDLKSLVDAGYAIERIVPVDQFLWSPHVEVIAICRRN